jgi:hypothetical protein
MTFRTLFTAASIVVAPIGAMAVVAGPAGASPAHKGAGTVTCSVAGDATFTPPLTPGGTPHVSHEVIQFTLAASGCTGPSANSPIISPTSGAIVTKAIKDKDAKVGKMRVAGACADGISFNPTVLLKSTITWAGANVQPSTTKLGPLSGVTNGTESGLGGTGTAKKSYPGASSVTLYLEPASLTALENTCKDGDTGTSVSMIDFDGATSSITVG